MRIQGKVWGSTAKIFGGNNISIHRIETNKGGFCSKHKHEHKFNKFFVESGTLLVRTWKNDYALTDETIIEAGQSTVVKPGEYHQFESITDCVVYEIYWTQLDEDDIVRENVGGNK